MKKSDGEQNHASGYCLSQAKRRLSAVGPHNGLVSHFSSALVVIFHLAFTLEDRHLFSVCQHFLHWFTNEGVLEYQFSKSFLAPFVSPLPVHGGNDVSNYSLQFIKSAVSQRRMLCCPVVCMICCATYRPLVEDPHYVWLCTLSNTWMHFFFHCFFVLFLLYLEM